MSRSHSVTTSLSYKRSEWKKIVATRKKDGSLETYVDTDRARVIKDSNVKIVNLVMEEDGKSRQISTGEELLNARSAVCSFFVDALVAQILREDYREELKNSESASGPSS